MASREMLLGSNIERVIYSHRVHPFQRKGEAALGKGHDDGKQSNNGGKPFTFLVT